MRPQEGSPRRPGEAAGGLWFVGIVGSLLLGTAGAQLQGMKHTERISLSSSGTPGNQDSEFPSISADGRYVAFASYADNLVPGDTNGAEDVFVRDRITGKTDRVSISSRESGAAGDRDSKNPVISADGSFVAFASEATNLVLEDTNGALSIFVRDRVAGKTELVSLTSDGAPTEGNSPDSAISGDGRFIAFASYSNNVVPRDTFGNTDVFVRDRVEQKTEIVTVSSTGAYANGSSCYPSISADGHYVAFCSQATNLDSRDRDSSDDVYVRDRNTNTTELVSLSSDGIHGNRSSRDPAISTDGRFVAFVSDADNLVPGDRNGAPDVFVRDRLMRKTVRASFVTASDPASDSFWGQAAISGDGSRVVFVYYTFAPGDTKSRWSIFVRDLSTEKTELISASDAGTPGDGTSLYPAISLDGRFVVFESTADNLVPGGTNGHRDIFVRGLAPRPGSLVVEPANLTFGRIPVGTTKKGTVMLRNAGPRPVTGTVGALAPPFTVVEGGGSFALEPGAGRAVTVAFAPTRPSDPVGIQARLAITSDDPSTPPLEVLLSGEGFSALDGRLALSPTREQGLTLTLNARELVYGECKDGSLLLQNNGTGPLTGRVEGLQAPFAVVEGAGEFVLQPGESRTVVVRFCPPVGDLPRLYGTVLAIASSDPQGLRVNVPVRVQPP